MNKVKGVAIIAAAVLAIAFGAISIVGGGSGQASEAAPQFPTGESAAALVAETFNAELAGTDTAIVQSACANSTADFTAPATGGDGSTDTYVCRLLFQIGTDGYCYTLAFKLVNGQLPPVEQRLGQQIPPSECGLQA